MSIQAKQRALALVEQQPCVMMLGTNGPDGTPEIKAILKRRKEGLTRFVFCCGSSAHRTEVLKKDNRASLYAYEFSMEAEPMVCRGLMLSGKIELSQDDDLRRSFWEDFMTMHYPKGPLDPEFVVVIFTAERGNYFEDLRKTDFSV